MHVLPALAILILKRSVLGKPWPKLASFDELVLLLVERLLGQTIVIILIRVRLDDNGTKGGSEEIALLCAVPDRSCRTRFFLKLDNSLAGGLATFVHLHHRTLERSENLKCLVQQFIRYVRRQVLNANGGRIRGEANTQNTVLARGSVQLPFCLFGVGEVVYTHEGVVLLFVHENLADFTERLEHLHQLLFRRIICEVTYVQAITAGKLGFLRLNRRNVEQRPLQQT
uniref:Secreted peptide n=1 Tax=Anopheles braziliensis TaxID=58242 RepID=A0A2M3ZLX9_9DIPT